MPESLEATISPLLVTRPDYTHLKTEAVVSAYNVCCYERGGQNSLELEEKFGTFKNGDRLGPSVDQKQFKTVGDLNRHRQELKPSTQNARELLRRMAQELDGCGRSEMKGLRGGRDGMGRRFAQVLLVSVGEVFFAPFDCGGFDWH